MFESSDNYHELYPEYDHYSLVRRCDEHEFILPEPALIGRFGEARWLQILSGQDSQFRAFLIKEVD